MRFRWQDHTLAVQLLAIAWALLVATAPALGQTGAESSVGYIDSALPLTQFRIRYEAASGINRPDEADWLWPGSSNPLRPAGSPLPDNHIDYQDLMAYMELAPTDRFSFFI